MFNPRLHSRPGYFTASAKKRWVVSSLLLLLMTFLAIRKMEKVAARQELVREQQAGRVTARVVEENGPWVHVAPGTSLPTHMTGTAGLVQSLSNGAIRPLALATADFDEDGVPDLLTAGMAPETGMLLLYRGNGAGRNPLHPSVLAKKAAGTSVDGPFFAEPGMISVPTVPELVGTGDFNADGHQDVVLTSLNATTLSFLPGDGKGHFGVPENIFLGGKLTALAVGECNRFDGLPEIVVGILTGKGPRLLIFESPTGAARSLPEVVKVPAPVTDLGFGLFDPDPWGDVAVGSGSAVLIVHGRDRKLSLTKELQATAPSLAMEQIAVPGQVVSLATGNFSGDFFSEITVLTTDGRLHLVGNPTLRQQAPKSFHPRAWTVASRAGGFDFLPTRLVKTKTSTLLNDEVVAFGNSGRFEIYSPNPEVKGNSVKAVSRLAAIQTEQQPVAILPLQLNSDALQDLVVLNQGSFIPSFIQTEPRVNLDVSTTNDAGPGSLRQAILDSNASIGVMDNITFSISGTISLSSQLPPINDPVIINATVGTIVIDGSALSAGFGGLLAVNASNSTISGLCIQNTPQGSSGDGAAIALKGNNINIQGNLLGTNIAGTAAAPNGNGILIFGGAASNTIGGTTPILRNLISGNLTHGVFFGSDDGTPAGANNKVIGNYIGVDISGNNPLPNQGSGVVVISGSTPVGINNKIGDTVVGSTNVLSGNGDDGIEITGSLTQSVLVQGNRIGTVAAGNTDAPNAAVGVELFGGTQNNLIGGTSAAARNIISGNVRDGVSIFNPLTNSNLIQGNYIGTTALADEPLGNGFYGVSIFNGSPQNNVIGGAVAGAGNLISGNFLSGVGLFDGATSNFVFGNLIGTDPAGTASLPNMAHGVYSQATAFNKVGGNVPQVRNIISGNQLSGVFTSGSTASGLLIEGNYIGTDITGMVALPNDIDGITVESGASNVTIGGGTGLGNLISGNTRHGIFFDGAGANGQVFGNRIGVDATNNVALGNGGSGVLAQSSAAITVGGTGAGQGNQISGNIQAGIELLSGSGTIKSNFIGVDSTGNGALANENFGISINGGSNVLIGGTTAADRNVISGNLQGGLRLIGASSNINVQGNYIGVTVNGTGSLGNVGDSLLIVNSTNCTIGGTTIGAGNVIAGGQGSGVHINGDSAQNNQVQGNLIGTNAAGTAALGNLAGGIIIDGASGNNQVGGTVANAGNLISGNTGFGIALGTSSNTNTIQGNLLGTDNTGNSPLGNSNSNILVASSNNLIGGTTASARNVICASGQHGILIQGSPTTNNHIEGNFIGIGANGTTAIGNTLHGVATATNATGNVIGGSGSGMRNVISGNLANGVFLGSDGNFVQGNYIGTEQTGATALPNGGDGVGIDGSNNMIGGTTSTARNVISGNSGYGIYVVNPTSVGNQIQGNYIGITASGTAALPNIYGIEVDDAQMTTIGGQAAGSGNVISGNTNNGIFILTTSAVNNPMNTAIQGNFIGTNPAGVSAIPNGDNGIAVGNSAGNQIGGTNAALANVISGNADDGLEIAGNQAQNNIVQGNFIGTNVGGTAPLGNVRSGVFINDAPNNAIGGMIGGSKNVISGNNTGPSGGFAGVAITGAGATGNVVQGNAIGTNATGTTAIPNGEMGVRIGFEAQNNMVGGTSPTERNVISGNLSHGVLLDNHMTPSGNQVQGNFIGTNASGSAALGNGGDGVYVVQSNGNLIGGTVAGSGNLISGNAGNGVRIEFAQSVGNTVSRNQIGTDLAGTGGIPNTGRGVAIKDANNNVVGGINNGNLIAFNGSTGVAIESTATGTVIRSNSIFQNGGLGIDLGANGVTANDSGDADSGPNTLQNFPVLTSVTGGAGTLTVTGNFNSTANTLFVIDFYGNTACDGSGNGEGESFLGTMMVTTDTGGNATINFNQTVPSVPFAVTATATSTGASQNTSEFSTCVPVGAPNTPPTITPAAPVTIQAGSSPTTFPIATVSDVETPAGNLVVTIGSRPTGVNIANIVNTAGAITADISTTCGAVSGPVTLIVTDAGSAMATGMLTINVTPNQPVVLGSYATTTITQGGTMVVSSSAAPTDNGTFSLSVSVSSGFTGTASVNSVTGDVTISNANPPGTYTVTVSSLDNCGAISNATFTLNVNASNTPPTITPAAPVTIQAGSVPATFPIATVSDVETPPGNLIVTAGAPPPGVTIANIVNTGGAITADISTSCAAGSGAVTLTVTDASSAMATGTLTINVAPNQPVTLGTYSATTISQGGTMVVTPSAPPTDNGTFSLAVSVSGSFSGTASVNQTTGAVTISNANPPGTYTVTVDGLDNCLDFSTTSFTLQVLAGNTPPTITPAAPVSVQAGSLPVNFMIATVSDVETPAGNLIVTAQTPPPGISINNIVNTGGTVTADITATCVATGGPVTLTVTDASLGTANATLVINVTANQPAVLGTYSATSVGAGGGTTVNPTLPPTDNGTFSLSASAGTSFTGTISVNSATGIVTITNANPPGNYTVTVTSLDNCGATSSTSFSLQVLAGNTQPTITPAGPITVQQGSPAQTLTIATVSDSETPAGNLLVNVLSVPTGVTLTNLTNSNGTVTGQVSASCFAVSGVAILQVTDGGGLVNTGNLSINVTPNTAPGLGTYPTTTVTAGGSTTVTPSAPPSDNGTITGVTVNAPGFGGTISVAPATGVVSISNANPPGTYTVSVTVSENCNASTTRSFFLQVNAPVNQPPTLGSYPPTTVNEGQSVVVVPTVPPTDPDGSVVGLTASAPGFQGQFVGDPATGRLSISNAQPQGVYTVTVKATDNSGSFVTQTFTLTVVNVPPTVTVSGPINRRQGQPGSLSTFATIRDVGSQANELRVSLVNAAPGLVISGLVNNNGTVSATIEATCSAALGPNIFTIQVSDRQQGVTADIVVNVQSGIPTLGRYTDNFVNEGQTTEVNPSAPPDGLGTNGLIVSVTPNTFAGTVQVAPTGVVTIGKAGPAGTYVVNVSGTGNCGGTVTQSFRLEVVNLAPTVRAGDPVALRQGATLQSALLATVRDAGTPAGNLQVSLRNLPSGISITNLTNVNGEISAQVTVGCSVPANLVSVLLEVSDGQLTASTPILVDVITNQPPTLGTYADLSVTSIRTATIPASAPPRDDETTFNLTVEPPTIPGGIVTIDRASGNVTLAVTDDALLLGQYSFTVQATDSCGQTTRTSFRLIVRLPGPTGLTAQRDQSSQVQLRWADNSDNEAGFKIERRTEGGTFALLTVTAPNVTQFTDQSTEPGVRYTYRVRAFKQAGDSDPSNEATVEAGQVTITQFYPLATAPGKTITIRGTGFAAGTQVFFGGDRRIPAASLSLVNPGMIRAVVPVSDIGTANLNGFLTIRVPGASDITSRSLPTNIGNPADPNGTFSDFVLIGDVDGDGILTALDLTTQLAVALGQIGAAPRQRLAADVAPFNANGSYGDGIVDAFDVTVLRAVLLRQISF
ncbi:MAG: fibronectin type III domain-containing protein [Blastocatellia bacterium]|nr:fibronectin type III domain-containing protein [Blastocatellia bacterium]